MPAYRVTSSSAVVVMGARYNPGDVFTTLAMLSPLPGGVTKTADAPAFDPVLQDDVKSGGIGGSGSVDVVSVAGGYSIILKALTGSVGIKFNVATNVEVVLHADDPALVVDCLSRVVWKWLYSFKEATSKVSVKVVKV